MIDANEFTAKSEEKTVSRNIIPIDETRGGLVRLLHVDPCSDQFPTLPNADEPVFSIKFPAPENEPPRAA